MVSRRGKGNRAQEARKVGRELAAARNVPRIQEARRAKLQISLVLLECLDCFFYFSAQLPAAFDQVMRSRNMLPCFLDQLSRDQHAGLMVDSFATDHRIGLSLNGNKLGYSLGRLGA